MVSCKQGVALPLDTEEHNACVAVGTTVSYPYNGRNFLLWIVRNRSPIPTRKIGKARQDTVDRVMSFISLLELLSTALERRIPVCTNIIPLLDDETTA